MLAIAISLLLGAIAIPHTLTNILTTCQNYTYQGIQVNETNKD